MSLCNESRISTVYRQIDLDCDCGQHIVATILALEIDSFDLTCSKCGRNFIEALGQIWGIRGGVITEWVYENQVEGKK